MLLRDPNSLQRNKLLRRTWEALGRPAGHVTGGFLRDHLLGRSTVDLDLTIPGSATDVGPAAQRLAASLGTRAHLIGTPPRCVWRIEADALKIEIWPLDALTLEEDVLRRDYTLNALMWHLPSGPLVDLVGGIQDITRGRIRAVARSNLDQDPVRLLRGPRFVSVLDGFDLDPQTAAWIGELAPGLAAAPRERVGPELLRLLGGGNAVRALKWVIELGVLKPASPKRVEPDIEWLRDHLDAAHRLTSQGDHPLPGALSEGGDAARLGFLMRVWRAPSLKRTADYAWTREARRMALRAASLLDHALLAHQRPPADRREMIHTAGDAFPTLMALAAAVHPVQEAAWRRWWRQWQELGDTLIHPAPLLTPDQIARLAGIEPGPELGEILEDLTVAQIRGEVRTVGGAQRWLSSRR